MNKYNIALIKVVACTLVVTGHVMQFIDCFLALWVNVGVQMFLFLSGYLYGSHFKGEKDYRRMLPKLLVPYYVFTIIVFTFCCVTHDLNLNAYTVFRLLSISEFNTIDGTGHLWYMPLQLCCYLILPIFYYFENKLPENNWLVPITVVCGIEFITQLYVRTELFRAPWIVCFYLGYIVCKHNNKRWLFIFNCIITFIAICGNIIYCIIAYSTHTYTGYTLFVINRLGDYGHVALAVVLVYMLSFIPISDKVGNILLLLSSYTFSMYLLHFFIMKRVSPMITEYYTALSLSICILLSLVLCIPFKFITDKLTSLCKAIINKIYAF